MGSDRREAVDEEDTRSTHCYWNARNVYSDHLARN